MSSRKLATTILAILLSVGLALSLVVAALSRQWFGFLLNLGTELVGAGIVYFLLERVIGLRQQEEARLAEIQARKTELIAQMRSRVRDVAVAAVEELGSYRWNYDGSLRNVDLGGPNLEGADLWYFDLRGVHMIEANLRSAKLYGTNLQRAVLQLVDLRGAALDDATLRKAYLEGVNLERASLVCADLSEAHLADAHLVRAQLTGADLQGAVFGRVVLRHAVLPDGTEWTADTDMARFTNPEHPNFWRSNDPRSPAYRGD